MAACQNSGTTGSEPLTEPLAMPSRKTARLFKEFEQYGIRPEEIYLTNGKHGIEWTEGLATAKSLKTPEGQWTLDGLKFAAEKAATLKVGGEDYLELPAGSKSVVHFPDGTTEKAAHIWIRNDGGKTFHGHPRIGVGKQK